MYLPHVWGQVLELEEKPAIQDWTEVPGCWQNPPFTSDLRQTESAYQCTKPTEFRTNNNRTGCALLCLAALSRPALCDPINCSPPRLLCPLEFPRQEYWSGLPCPPPGDLSNPGMEPRSPALQDSLPSEAPGKPSSIVWPELIQTMGDSLKWAGRGWLETGEILQQKSTESVDASSRLLKIADIQTSSLDSFPKWGLHPFLKSL